MRREDRGKRVLGDGAMGQGVPETISSVKNGELYRLSYRPASKYFPAGAHYILNAAISSFKPLTRSRKTQTNPAIMERSASLSSQS